MMDYISELRLHVGHRLLLMPGVTVVGVEPEGRVLWHRRGDDGLWSLPGGALEEGDRDFAHAAAREVAEETGIAVHPERLRPFASLSDAALAWEYPNGDRVRWCALAFIVWLDADDLKLLRRTDEAIDFRMLAPNFEVDHAHPFSKRVVALYENWITSGRFQSA